MPPLSRREFLQALALFAACIPTTGCERVLSQATKYMGLDIPDTIPLPNSDQIDPAFHLLSRAAYGAWPGELEEVSKMGVKAWVERQLQPESIDDEVCRLRSRRFESLLLPAGECYEFKPEVLRRDLVRHALLRAVYSKRQLNEVMVEFWTDHLNINIGKGDCIYLKAFDDRAVIRKYALGKFKDLIRASAVSPAMLVYLDGAENKKGSPTDVPNENYARELMELHTLGVDGGYTQHDVLEAARCLTGWTVKKDENRGKANFEIALHDQGEKSVLGTKIPANGGEQDLDRVVSIVCEHPSTAKHIAKKLCVRFVSENPPQSIIDKTAETFRTTGGGIKETVKRILLSEEFANAKGEKIKRPFQFIASSLRMIGADTHAHDPLVEYLLRMGQGPFQYPTPDGYPDEGAPWLGTLLWRWNFAFELCSGNLPTVSISLPKLSSSLGAPADEFDRIFTYFCGRSPRDVELKALQHFATNNSLDNHENKSAMYALVMSSPAFLRC